MDSHDSITEWIGQLQDGADGAAQEKLFNRYFKRLAALARRRLQAVAHAAVDEEDVALMALNNFFAAARRGRFPQLRDRTNLWPLLVQITARQAINERKRQLADKRGAGRVRGESVFLQRGSGTQWGGIGQAVGAEPTPGFLAELREEFHRRLGSLGEGELRTIAKMKLEGYTNAEIAEKCGVMERTIERKLKRIRSIWSTELGEFRNAPRQD